MSETYIPASALRMAIVMVNAADQCDQAGQWDRDHRRACEHILDWVGSNDYKITCEKAGASAYICDQYRPAKPLTNADRIRRMTEEELAEMVSMKVCRIVKTRANDYECPKGFYFGKCNECVLAWLRKEAGRSEGGDDEG